MSSSRFKVTTLPGGTVRRRVRPAEPGEVAGTPNIRLPADLAQVLSGRQCLELIDRVDPVSSTVRFVCQGLYALPGLPGGYYFKGGAAREQLRSVLTFQSGKIQVRDFDLFRYMDSPDTHDHELAMRFMPDDYEYGRGVEVVENKPVYFRTRDLTVNEALAWNGHVEASFQAIRDMLDGVLRPTAFVQNRAGDVLSVTVAKAYRFAAEAQIAGHPFSFAGIPDQAFVSTFAAALNLERSFMTHEAVAIEYLQLLWERTTVFKEWDVPPPPVDAVRFLSARIPNGLRLFKSLSPSLLAELARSI